MKKLALLILNITMFGSIVQSKNLSVFMDYATFNAAGQSPYLEAFFSVVGSSLIWEKSEESAQFNAAVEVLISISEEDSVIYMDRYKLNGPSITDTTGDINNFIDIQRIPLKNGSYNVYIEVSDAANPMSSLSSSIPVVIDYQNSQAKFSDIQFVERYSKATQPSVLTKSGFDLIPLLPFYSYYYPGTVSQMNFYAELYNMDQKIGANEPYLVQYYIESEATKELVPKFAGFERKTASPAEPVLRSFNLANLANGRYRLVLEARDKENQIIARNSIAFVRENPDLEINIEDNLMVNIENTFINQITNEDTLKTYIDYLYPISDRLERRVAGETIKRGDIAEMQRFFFSFWSNRDKYNPESVWDVYHDEVKLVNKLYSTRIRKGYNTDRGRVHLQYGIPDDRDGRPFEPGAYPYEIWMYYTLEQNNQRNIIFVFMNRDLSTNDFELIHSDALGEINDPNWQMQIVQRDVATRNMDITDAPDRWGSSIQNNIIIPNR